MKITFKKKAFEQHLDNVSKAIQSNSPFPSLKGILITATESNVQLIASNGNLSIKEVVEQSGSISIKEAGRVLVPGSLFVNIIKKQDEDITVVYQDNTVLIESNGAQTSLQPLNANDYPTLSFDTIGKDLVIDAEALESVIKNVSSASGENDRRIILNGVNLSSKEGKLTATATNSFRLAKEVVEIDSNSEFNITILTKNLRDFMPNNVKGPLTIAVNDSKIITKHQSTTIMSKLIDGVYPDTSALIPTQFSRVLKADSRELQNLIDKATVVADDANKVIKLTISSDLLKVESKRREVGDSVVQMASPE